MERILTESTVLIRKGELIVGAKTPTPLGSPLYPEFNCAWIQSELETLASRAETAFHVSAGTLNELKTHVIPYWPGRTVLDRIVENVPSSSLKAVEEGLFFHYYLNRSIGHITVNYEKVITKGLAYIREEIRNAREALSGSSENRAEKEAFYDALSRVLEAIIALAHRYAREADRMAEACQDPERKKELAQIAANCLHVPEFPAETFWQALQSFWFVHLALNLESNSYAISPGRFDQYIHPALKQDYEQGRCTPDQALELVHCLWIKFAELTVAKEGGTAKASNTYTDFQNLNVGGLKPDGSDGVNDVSYLCLRAQKDLLLPQPQLSVLISAKSPQDFLLKSCELARMGTGMPAFYNADELIVALMDKGKSLDDARRGAINGCVEITGQGNDFMASSGYINLAKCLELALNDGASMTTGIPWGPKTGKPEHFGSMDDLWAAFEAQIEAMVALKIRYDNGARKAFADHCPAPVTSLFVDGCVPSGRDYHQGGARYHLPMLCGVGTGTVTDSLAAIDHFVFGEKTVDLATLAAALKSNFTGHEPLRELLWNKAPKYGNDLGKVDRIAAELVRRFVRILKKFTDDMGHPYAANMIPTTTHLPFGDLTAATADGRLAGRPLSEGISPVQGKDLAGPTAVVKTMGGIDHASTAGTLLNMKFSPKTLEGEGLPKFASLIRSYFDLGGHHMQFNVTSREALLAAQERPDEHRSLLVRVAGYSDYFVRLSREVQDEVISRMEHGR
jgi:formate C-acetyltransferase